MERTLYVITHYRFNHTSERPNFCPLDPRLLSSPHNLTYFLIDDTRPDLLKEKNVLFERDFGPEIQRAGRKFFAEWSFLLAEKEKSFCKYPFYMVSSRFYEKNRWLQKSLDHYWEKIFSHLMQYGYGFLPSYDRPLRLINFSDVKKRGDFFPLTEIGLKRVKEVYDVDLFDENFCTADLFCNYIGFRSREDFLKYMDFYEPLIDGFFTKDFEAKCDLSMYVKRSGSFRNEKPFTFFLESLSHLYFYVNRQPYFALHYDGLYEIEERMRHMKKLEKIPIPRHVRLKRALEWRLKSNPKVRTWLGKIA